MGKKKNRSSSHTHPVDRDSKVVHDVDVPHQTWTFAARHCMFHMYAEYLNLAFRNKADRGCLLIRA